MYYIIYFLRMELASKDSYGNRKLEGEEVLAKYHKLLNYDYILLRLPDVFGPRDNTHRFWKYYMWTKLHQIIGPVHVPLEIKNKELSFVYSEDVAKLIVSLLREENKEIRNNAYNLAFKTSVTFKDFIKEIMQCLNLDLAEDELFDESESAYLNFGIPSVTKGPVSTDKAEQLLNWQPSDFSKAVKETCKFYEEAQYTLKYKFMLDIVLDKLGVRGEKYRDYLEHHFDKMQKMEL